jgi:cation/acetate symporter
MDQTTLNIIVCGAVVCALLRYRDLGPRGSTSEFYAAGRGVNPVTNGMATAADWMSAASFISMAGLIAFVGYNNSLFLMGWTGGYVLLAMLLAPVPAEVRQVHGARVHRRPVLLQHRARRGGDLPHRHLGDLRDRSDDGCRRGVLPLPRSGSTTGLFIGPVSFFVYAVLGGMKGITYTQVAQYCVLIVAYTIPAIFISLQLTGNPIPGLGLFSNMTEGMPPVVSKRCAALTKLDGLTDRSWLQRVHGHHQPG